VHDELRAICDDYWDATLRASPTFATLIGDHRFDDRIEDFSAAGEDAERATLLALRARAAVVDPATLDGTERVTHGLLLHEIDDRVRMIDLATTELRSDQMDGPAAGYLVSAPQLAAGSPDSADALLRRLEQLGGALDTAAERFLAGAARGRTPARLAVTRTISMIDGYLASSLDADVFVGIAAPPDWPGEAAWRDRLRAVARDAIRPGFARHRAVLAERLLPVARPDDRAGLCWLDDGAELYDALVGSYTSLALGAEAIHAIGLEEIEQRLPAEYAEVGGRELGLTDPGAVLAHLRTDPALRYTSETEILEVARAALGRAAAAMGQWFGRLPQAACRIEPVPAAVAADSPAAYYFPPTSDGSRPGTYFVNTHEPAGKNRFEAESIAFHEAIPGHHLQLAIASELDGLPAFRTMGMGNTAYVEGWGLYAERLADEMGLYSGDLDRLGMLAADSWRAGRLVADTGLHALGWSRQRTIDWFTANTPVADDEIAVEVDRYVAIPGQAVSYKLGQREIFRLRDRARTALGDAFDIAAFHDVVLGSGGVTLPVLATLVDEWIAAPR